MKPAKLKIVAFRYKNFDGYFCFRERSIEGRENEPLVTLSDANAAIQAAYEQGKREAVPEWQPIETAPEATHVFVWLPNYGTVRGIFTTDQSRQRWWNGEEVIYPTHWMPLPASPTPPKGEVR